MVKTKEIRPRKIRIDSTTIETNIPIQQIWATAPGGQDVDASCQRSGVKISNHVHATKKPLRD